MGIENGISKYPRGYLEENPKYIADVHFPCPGRLPYADRRWLINDSGLVETKAENHVKPRLLAAKSL